MSPPEIAGRGGFRCWLTTLFLRWGHWGHEWPPILWTLALTVLYYTLVLVILLSFNLSLVLGSLVIG